MHVSAEELLMWFLQSGWGSNERNSIVCVIIYSILAPIGMGSDSLMMYATLFFWVSGSQFIQGLSITGNRNRLPYFY